MDSKRGAALAATVLVAVGLGAAGVMTDGSHLFGWGDRSLHADGGPDDGDANDGYGHETAVPADWRGGDPGDHQDVRVDGWNGEDGVRRDDVVVGDGHDIGDHVEHAREAFDEHRDDRAEYGGNLGYDAASRYLNVTYAGYEGDHGGYYGHGYGRGYDGHGYESHGYGHGYGSGYGRGSYGRGYGYGHGYRYGYGNGYRGHDYAYGYGHGYGGYYGHGRPYRGGFWVCDSDGDRCYSSGEDCWDYRIYYSRLNYRWIY